MNLNTNTKKLTLTKTERGYLSKAKSVLDDLARLSEGDVKDAADSAASEIHRTQALLAGTPAQELAMPY